MDPLRELLPTGHFEIFNFFLTNLRDEVIGKDVRRDEILYTTSVLAHHAQVSSTSSEGMPSPVSLAEFFENFVERDLRLSDPVLLEFGVAQVLYLAGFFREQVSGRHNVMWYDRIGQSFCERLERFSPEPRKRDFFGHFSLSFPFWTRTCSDLNKTLLERQFDWRLIRPRPF